MITQRLMKPGAWDLTLVPETPKATRDLLVPYGHLVVMESPLDSRIVLDADMKSNALYFGILQRRPTPFKMSGIGVTGWLGDDEDKASTVYEAGLTLTAKTFVQSLTTLIPGTLTVGAFSAIGAGTITTTFKNVSPRAAFDFICAYFGGEYRVNNDGSVDAGLSSALFKTTPQVIMMPDIQVRESLPPLIGFQASTLNLEVDAGSETHKVVLVGAAGQGTASNASPYKDLLGNAYVPIRVVNDSQAAAGQEATAAGAALALYPLRQAITMATDRFDVARDLQPGDSIWAYEPNTNLEDITNEVHYAGDIVHPLKLRAFAMTWPVETGMGVYYRDLNGVYTDLTRWIAWEGPGTTLEVGAPARPLS